MWVSMHVRVFEYAYVCVCTCYIYIHAHIYIYICDPPKDLCLLLVVALPIHKHLLVLLFSAFPTHSHLIVRLFSAFPTHGHKHINHNPPKPAILKPNAAQCFNMALHVNHIEILSPH